MNSFSNLSRKEKAIELLRWLMVLPAAVIGALAVKFIISLPIRLAIDAGWITPGTSALLYYLRVLAVYAPNSAAFVIAGAMIAPRARLATTIILTAVGILMSLVIHVVGQNNVGYLNYIHFAMETLGALVGAGCMILLLNTLFAEPPSDDDMSDYVA